MAEKGSRPRLSGGRRLAVGMVASLAAVDVGLGAAKVMRQGDASPAIRSDRASGQEATAPPASKEPSVSISATTQEKPATTSEAPREDTVVLDAAVAATRLMDKANAPTSSTSTSSTSIPGSVGDPANEGGRLDRPIDTTTTTTAPETLLGFEVSAEQLQKDGFDMSDGVQAVFDDGENHQGPYTLTPTHDERAQKTTTVFTTPSQNGINTFKLIREVGDDGVVQNVYAGIFTTGTAETPEHEVSSVRFSFQGAVPELMYLKEGAPQAITNQAAYDEAINAEKFILGLARDSADLDQQPTPAVAP